MPLSKEAQDLIKDSIAIVREDRFERYVRDRYDRESAKGKENEPEPDSKTPPPAKDEPTDPPKRKSAWWGELDDDTK